MGLPLWVKPARLGSSVGISKVTSPERGLDEAVELARRHDPRVIVEAHGGGKEVECSVIGNEVPQTSPPGEIVAHADWYDYEAKYSEGGMELVVPARIGEAGDGAGPRARRAGVPGDRRLRPRPLRLLRPRRRRGPGQRDQHDPRLHRDQRVRKAVRGRRRSPYPELCDRLVKLALERYETRRGFEF